MENLLVHGGTRLSGRVVEGLLEQGVKPLVTVTRDSARDLYPGELNGRVRVGRLSPESLDELLESESVAAILDATHPYADRISQNAIRAAKDQGLPYLYLDRESVLPEQHPRIEYASRWVDAGQLPEASDRILLTIGIKHLDVFAENHDSKRLIARVLPDEESIRRARQLGVPRKNILAMWPPESAEFEGRILVDYDVDVLVTKDSGPSGNLPEKWSACKQTDTGMVVVERPDVEYPDRTLDLGRAVEWGVRHVES